jgi:hypothetical protein
LPRFTTKIVFDDESTATDCENVLPVKMVAVTL